MEQSKPSFTKSKVTNLMGKTEVRIVEDNPDPQHGEPFTLVADAGGVRFTGNSTVLETREHLNQFAKIVAQAWTAHEELQKEVRASLMS